MEACSHEILFLFMNICRISFWGYLNIFSVSCELLTISKTMVDCQTLYTGVLPQASYDI